MHKHLTNQLAERARPPARAAGSNAHTATYIWDDSIIGFALRISDLGTKTFVFQGRPQGRRFAQRLAIGRFPDIDCAQARQAALELKARCARGSDPAVERRAKREEPTFGDLCTSYFSAAEAHGVKSLALEKRRIEHHCLNWQHRKASGISAAEVAALHRAMARKRKRIPTCKFGPREHGGQVLANRVCSLIARIYHYAAKPDALARFDGANPALGIARFREQPRERYLSDDELHRVNRELLKERNPYVRAYFPLAMMLGSRKNELLTMRWEYIDLDAQVLRLPAERMKSARAHVLPLSEQACDLLRSLPSFAQRAEGGEGFVFPGKGKKGHRRSMTEAWARIRKRAGVNDCTIHDLRHTLASKMIGAGFSLPLIGKVLGHSRIATTQRYAHLELEPQRAALDLIAQKYFGAQSENLN